MMDKSVEGEDASREDASSRNNSSWTAYWTASSWWDAIILFCPPENAL